MVFRYQRLMAGKARASIFGLFSSLAERRGKVKPGIAGHKADKQKFVDELRIAFGAHARIEVGGAALDE
jgi:hypothetical protein